MTWLPGYEHDPELGAGHQPLPGRRKVIVHTTETPRGSWTAVRNLWRGGPTDWAKGLPHFLADGNRYVQLLPLTTCAYTSKGGPDAANKAGTPIQVEVVGHADLGLSDVEYEAMGRWIADLIRAGIDLDLDQCPRFFGDNEGIVLARESSPVRQIITDQFGGFAGFNGICGHQHLRGNDHWDPGHLDVERVCHIARSHLGGGRLDHGDEVDMATPAEIIDPIYKKLDLLFAKQATEIREWIATARAEDQEAQVNIQGNLAALIRGEAGATRDWLKAGLDGLDADGELPAGVDASALDALADALAPRLTTP